MLLVIISITYSQINYKLSKTDMTTTAITLKHYWYHSQS